MSKFNDMYSVEEEFEESLKREKILKEQIRILQIKNGKLQVQIEKLKLDKEEYYLDYLTLNEKINKIKEEINKYESIKAYYSYEEDGYEELNYDEDLKEEILDIINNEE